MAEAPSVFLQLRKQYLTYCQQHPVPPAIHHKLMFLGDCILGLQEAYVDPDDVEPEHLQQLRQIDRDSQIRLFLSIARCVMGLQPADSLRDRQAYIRKDAMFSRWHKCLLTTAEDKLYIRQKETSQISTKQIRIANQIKHREGKYCFLIEIKKKMFVIGSKVQKNAQQIHAVIKQMVLETKTHQEVQQKQQQQKEKSLDFSRDRIQNEDEEEGEKQQVQDYEVADIEDETNYKLDCYIDNGRILRNQFNPHLLKCFLLIKMPKTSNPNPCQQVLNIFMNFIQWNPDIEQYSIINKTDTNTYIVYQKYKKSSFIALARDYVVIKKAGKINDEKYFLSQATIEHRDYPSQYLTVRGSAKRVTAFLPKNINEQKVIMLITKMEVAGNSEDYSIAVRHLKSYEKFTTYCIQKMMLDAGQRFFMFDLPKTKKAVRKFLSLQDHIPKSPPTIHVPTLLEVAPRSINSAISQDFISLIRSGQHLSHYIKHKYVIEQKKEKGPQIQRQSDFFLQQGRWVISPDKEMVFVNQAEIDAQKDVIKHIIKQIGSNLVSGKSIMNMSLPVEIFDDRSIVQRTSASYGYAPIYLTQAGICQDPVQQMKNITLFSLSIPLLQMRLQKPFNPILGQTFQGYLGGIPIMMEQVCHHPPVSAYYMRSEDFILSGSSFPRAQMHFNSVTGINAGTMTVQLPKMKTKYEIFLPNIQVSGLLYGDRKLNITHKIFIINREQQIFCQISMGKEKPGVYSWSNKTKRMTPTSIIGGIYHVTPAFLQKFKNDKKKQKFQGLQKKDIIQRHVMIEGYWNDDVTFDDKVVRKLYDPLPYPLQYEPYPLASDCMYRQDILYKRMNKNEISNTKKQELENLQRRDRKLRAEHKKH